jgi:hypothetical protein
MELKEAQMMEKIMSGTLQMAFKKAILIHMTRMELIFKGPILFNRWMLILLSIEILNLLVTFISELL